MCLTKDKTCSMNVPDTETKHNAFSRWG